VSPWCSCPIRPSRLWPRSRILVVRIAPCDNFFGELDSVHLLKRRNYRVNVGIAGRSLVTGEVILKFPVKREAEGGACAASPRADHDDFIAVRGELDESRVLDPETRVFEGVHDTSNCLAPRVLGIFECRGVVTLRSGHVEARLGRLRGKLLLHLFDFSLTASKGSGLGLGSDTQLRHGGHNVS